MSEVKEFLPMYIWLTEIWADQAEFNTRFRTAPAPTFEQRTADTKELILHLISECDELLRASGAWKSHRRMTVRENRRHVLMEIADVFKYLISIAQIHGITEKEFADAYWEKSMVVRQRYAQEFMCALNRPAIIVDLDNVLVDYIAGFAEWMWRNQFIPQERAATIMTQHLYCDARTMQLPSHLYEEAKHLFRASGEHALLPAMTDAHQFITWLNARSELIVVLTARPIDRYPNLYGETLQWLKTYGLDADVVWWASNKADALRDSDIRPHVVFAVDDEERYVRQYFEAAIPCYWLTADTQRKEDWEQLPHRLTTPVSSLSEIISLETEQTK